MNPLNHLSYPVLFFVLLAKIFHIHYSFFDLLLLMFFSVLPDFDLLFVSLFSKREQKFSFFNLLFLIFASIVPEIAPLSDMLSKEENLGKVPKHRRWFTHLPFAYLPLIILFFLKQKLALFLICFGIYSHFILDTFIQGEIMWLYPFSQKRFSLFTQKIKDCEPRTTTPKQNKFATGQASCIRGDYLNYLKTYKKTIFYKIDILSFFLLLIILLKTL